MKLPSSLWMLTIPRVFPSQSIHHSMYMDHPHTRYFSHFELMNLTHLAITGIPTALTTSLISSSLFESPGRSLRLLQWKLIIDIPMWNLNSIVGSPFQHYKRKRDLRNFVSPTQIPLPSMHSHRSYSRSLNKLSECDSRWGLQAILLQFYMFQSSLLISYEYSSIRSGYLHNNSGNSHHPILWSCKKRALARWLPERKGSKSD